MHTLTLTITDYALEALLMAVNYIIMMLQLALGLGLMVIALWVLAMTVTVPCMVIKSLLTTNK